MAENRCALEGRQVNFWGWVNTIVMLLVNNFSLTSANVTTLICKVRLDIVPGSHIWNVPAVTSVIVMRRWEFRRRIQQHRTQNGSPGNNEGTLLGDPGTLLRKGHVPLMCSLILHMTHQHHLLCHDYEPTFILHLPPCVLHRTGGLVFQIKADVDGVLSCQRPSVVWLRYWQQVNYVERSRFTLPIAPVCVFSLFDFSFWQKWSMFWIE